MRSHLDNRSSYHFELPNGQIASQPLEKRTDSRLLVHSSNAIRHGFISEILKLLEPNDLLIVNDTRVIKARLRGMKLTGGKVDILVEKIESTCVAICHVKAARGLSFRHEVRVGHCALKLLERVGDLYRLQFGEPVQTVLSQYGLVPLPPYIDRVPTSVDETRYQTVYGEHDGAVAAPTAGLHFDKELLARIKKKGITICPITLHIGVGTFQSVRIEDLTHVSLHSEHYRIPSDTRQALNARKGRCVAVGTTVVRALEHAALTGEDKGETSLFIKPGFNFQVVDALITNFHLPESTLLMLVCAFCGYEETMQCYEIAVREDYRFFSYGDAMWCEKNAI